MNTRNPRWVVALVVVAAAVSSKGETNLSLEGAVQAALMGNRELAAARFRLHEAHARLRGAGLLPNPDFEFAGMSDFAFSGEGEGAFTVGLSQRFPLTARLSADRQARRIEVALALREIRNEERLLIARVQSLYAGIQAARLRETGSDAARRSVRELASLASKRLSAGQGSVAEVGLARVEERSWAAAVAAARTAAESMQMDLKTALGLPANAELVLTESLDAIVTSLRRGMRAVGVIHRPDAERALLEMDLASAEARLARADAWEGIRLGVEYTYDHAVDEPSGLGTSEFLGLRVSVPLPVWNQHQSVVAERKAAQERASANARAIELEIENSIAVAAKRVALYGAEWEAYRSSTENVVAQSERELAGGFDQGRVDLRDLLAFRARTAVLRIDAVTLRENLALALIAWQAATGAHPSVGQPYTATKTVPSKPIRKKP